MAGKVVFPVADYPDDEIPPGLEEQTIAEIKNWWVATSIKDADGVIPKAVEYGSTDFDIMGAAMIGLRPDHWAAADPGERLTIAREMAIMFYILGKVGRAMSAYAEGRLPSEDTLKDLVVYGMMARRVRETGAWV